MNDSWRDSYDAWKLATPPEYEGPTCSGCGEFLQCDHGGIRGWSRYCERCDAPGKKGACPACGCEELDHRSLWTCRCPAPAIHSADEEPF